jgi:hypothetical protein
MQVDFERVPTFDAIFADGDFIALAECCERERVVRIFVTTVVANGASAIATFEQYAAVWGVAHQQAATVALQELQAAGVLVDRLWAAHGAKDDGGQLRGAMIEGLVRRSLSGRYASGDLVDNATVIVRNGVNFKSKRTIDVTGWDGAVGECHDCKANPFSLKVELLADLEDGLPRAEFKIGIVTARSASITARALRQIHFRPSKRTTVIPLERLWDLAPLQV